MNDTRDRIHLEALVDDPATPKVLRTEISRHLEVYDRAVALHAAARAAREHIAIRTKALVVEEPRRLVDLLHGKKAPSVDDIALDLPGLNEAEALSEVRVTIARNATRHAWNQATTRPFVHAVDDVLPWMAEARLATPWHVAMPAHLAYAWNQATNLYTWHLPMVTPAHRFLRLNVERPTLAMQRTWQAVRDGDLEVLELGPPRRHRVTAYWPDLNADSE